MSEANSPESKRMFGCNIDEYMASVKDSITFKTCGPSMVVGSILSDVQEMMEHNDLERARQMVNIAKYIIFQSEMTLPE